MRSPLHDFGAFDGHVLRFANRHTLVCLGDEPYNERCRAYAEKADWLVSEAFCLDADAKNPYSLQRRSKVRGLGLYQTWMASVNDIRGAGFPRANGTSVDLGCYQCWLPDVGFVLTYR